MKIRPSYSGPGFIETQIRSNRILTKVSVLINRSNIESKRAIVELSVEFPCLKRLASFKLIQISLFENYIIIPEGNWWQ